MTTPDLPPGLPPLPPNTRYAGQLRDHSGRLFAFIYCPEDPDGWEYSGEWIGMDSDPQANTADWHVAIPIEAVREPAVPTPKAIAAAKKLLDDAFGPENIDNGPVRDEPAEVPASGYPLHHPQGPKDWPEDASLENGGYQNNCCKCQGVFYRHKRRVFCRECCQPASGVEAIATREWCVKSAEIEGEAEVGAGTRTGVEARACEWQPIETAPRDGTDVLVWDDGLMRIAAYDAAGKLWWVFGQGEYTPTHWQPLPPPPAERSDQ